MEQSELLRHLVATFEQLGVPYLVTGSVAVEQRPGQSPAATFRLTAES